MIKDWRLNVLYKQILYGLQYLPEGIRKKITRKIAYYLADTYAHVSVKNQSLIPEDESVIFIGNHLSNLDGLLLSKFFEESKKKTYFLAGVKLKGDSLTNAVLEIVPHIEIEPNKPDRKAIKNAIQTLKSGNSILIFPEGTRSRTGAMIKGRSGVYLIAKMAGVRIVPVAISGSEKCLPVDSEGNMSKESLSHAEVSVVFGEPFYLDSLEGPDEPVDMMMKRIAELLPKEYRGYYL